MNTFILIVIIAVVTIALRLLWRWFIRATDREIDKSIDDFRRQGIVINDPRKEKK